VYVCMCVCVSATSLALHTTHIHTASFIHYTHTHIHTHTHTHTHYSTASFITQPTSYLRSVRSSPPALSSKSPPRSPPPAQLVGTARSFRLFWAHNCGTSYTTPLELWDFLTTLAGRSFIAPCLASLRSLQQSISNLTSWA
jgi:hypothetical protein